MQREECQDQKQSRDTDILRMKNLLKFQPHTLISGGVKDNCIYCDLNPLFLSTGLGKNASDTPKIF